MQNKNTNSTSRYAVLDAIRGFALVHMILYHTSWDLVYLFGFDWPWYRSYTAYLWQQSICWSFIFLAGFCQSLGRQRYRRGWIVFSAGALISILTRLLMPQNQILFGVLTLIGSCLLIVTACEPLLNRIPPLAGFLLNTVFFIWTKNVPQGYLGLGKKFIISLPRSWYTHLYTAYLGFPPSNFHSTDYFPLIPWLFLFTAGYFSFRYWKQQNLLHLLKPSFIPPLEWLGRHSLIIYLLHQPLLYLLLRRINN